MRRPVFKAATNHRGCFPRPDQVSVGLLGLRYFGRTSGYLRRRRTAPDEFCSSVSRSSPSRWSCERRFSNSRFSVVRRADRIRPICSCNRHNSSTDMLSKSNLWVIKWSRSRNRPQHADWTTSLAVFQAIPQGRELGRPPSTQPWQAHLADFLNVRLQAMKGCIAASALDQFVMRTILDQSSAING